MPRSATSPEASADPEPDADQTAADAGADAELPPAAPPREPGFFGWLRRLDLPRRPGWLGGVCAGAAERLGVDPLLVRGVVVVIAVLGGPAALLYALAWFLLPDADGTIHAQELGRGRVSRAVPGIVGVFLLSFLPLAQGFWFTGAFYWGDPGWAGAALRVLWTAALIAAAYPLTLPWPNEQRLLLAATLAGSGPILQAAFETTRYFLGYKSIWIKELGEPIQTVS